MTRSVGRTDRNPMLLARLLLFQDPDDLFVGKSTAFHKSVSLMDRTLPNSGGIQGEHVRDYPLFAPIKNHPRFVALFDKIDEVHRLARIEVGLDEPAKSEPPK